MARLTKGERRLGVQHRLKYFGFHSGWRRDAGKLPCVQRGQFKGFIVKFYAGTSVVQCAFDTFTAAVMFLVLEGHLK